MADDRYREIARRHLDEQCATFEQVLPANPPDGWIRTIREALGMSRADLARRLGLTAEAVKRYETTEAQGTIQLDTLTRVANALGAHVRYAVVPDQPLEQTVRERALELARSELAQVDHTMNLEGQLPSRPATDQLERRVDELRRSSRLWNEQA